MRSIRKKSEKSKAKTASKSDITEQELMEAAISLLDSRMLVSSFDAFSTAKRLLSEEGIFAGVSSGSVVYGAIRQAERMDKGDIVCLLADGGWKYLSTALWTKNYEQLAKESKGKIWW